MAETTSTAKAPAGFAHSLEVWFDRQTWRLARHWLLVFNTLLAVFAGLPLLAPILLAKGFTGPANAIYSAYRHTCHQLPSRSYFILGEQVAFCHRDLAIWASILLGGLLFTVGRNRLKPLPFEWYVLALIPIAVDGGTQLISPLLAVLPGPWLLAAALIVAGPLLGLIYRRYALKWQYALFFLMGPLSVAYVLFTGPRVSNWQLRTITGAIYGLATVLLVFPHLARGFADIQQQIEERRGWAR